MATESHWRVIEASTVFRFLDRTVAVFWLAVDDSVIVISARRLADRWNASPWPLRRRFAGTTILAAVATHTFLTLLQGAPPGWWWMILPALGAALGAMLLAASVPSSSDRSSIDT